MMTHEEAFLQDIGEHLDDDVPRLVYADWLHDEGEESRAELIRVQCALARCDKEDPHQEELHARSAALLAEHRRQWCGEVAPYLQKYAFSRGLLNSVEMDPSDFVEQAPKLARLGPVSVVTLTPPRKSDGLVRFFQCPHILGLRQLCLAGLGATATELAPLWQCSRLENLRSLDLGRNRLGVEGMRSLTGSPVFEKLVHLGLASTGMGLLGMEILAVHPGLQKLRSLDLESDQLGSIGIQTMAYSRHLGGLRQLRLGHNEISASGLRALLGNPHLKGLVELRLANNPIRADGVEALVKTPWFPTLEVLDLDRTHLGTAGISVLTTAKVVPPLKELRLAGNDLGEKGLTILARWPGLARLEMIDLSQDQLDPFTLKSMLTALRGAPLRTLLLTGNKLKSLGAQVLANWPGLQHVRCLSLAKCDLGDEATASLAASPHLKRLSFLDLTGNDISLAGQEAFLETVGDRVEDILVDG